jgi:hypothetical protein
MKRTTLLFAMAILFLFSCKVVEIDKQPIKTIVQNTPTVNVANFPNTQSSHPVESFNGGYTHSLQPGPGETIIIEYIAAAPGSASATITFTSGNQIVLGAKNGTANSNAGISEKVFIVLIDKNQASFNCDGGGNGCYVGYRRIKT